MKNNDFNLISNLSAEDLASKAWRLYFYNCHKVFNYSILFVLLVILFFTLNIEPSSDAPVYFQLVYFLVTKPYISIILVFFIFLFFNGFIILTFYNSIINETISFPDYFKLFRLKLPTLLRLWLFLFVELLLFLFIDIILGLFGYLIVYLQEVVKNYFEYIRYIDPFIFIILMIISIIIISSQLLIISLQIIAILVDNLPIKKAFYKSLEFFFLSFKKSIRFSFYVVTLFLNVQFTLYILLMLIIRLSAEILLPKVVQESNYENIFVIVDLLSFSVSTIIFWPFLISGVTVFYYHQKAFLEGIDLIKAVKCNI